MSDRELLEWAAKAAGIEFGVIHQRPHRRCPEGWTPWNPLTDDGDALRLAVKLGIAFSCRKGNAQAVVERGPGGWFFEPFDEPVKDDQDASTRRAIVRAAASIGQQKEQT